MSDTMFPKREDRTPYGRGRTNAHNKEANQSRSKRTEKKPKKKRLKKGGKKRIRRLLILIGVLALVFIVYFCVRKNGMAVFLNEEQIGILEGRKITAEQLAATLESQLETAIGSDIKINETIKMEGVHISGKNKKDICTLEHLIPKLRGLVSYQIDAAVITINGEKAAVLANLNTAESVLKKLQNELLPKGGVSLDTKVEWVEDVQVTREYMDSEEVLTPENALTALKTTTETVQTYTVEPGDALYLIAQEYKTTVDKLINMNPGAELKKSIRIGQIINVPVQKAKLSVKTIETQVLTTVEPKIYQTQYDETKPSSYQKIVQQGKAGQKKSTIQITRVNGEVIDEREVAVEIIQEAVPEIIIKGTN